MSSVFSNCSMESFPRVGLLCKAHAAYSPGKHWPPQKINPNSNHSSQLYTRLIKACLKNCTPAISYTLELLYNIYHPCWQHPTQSLEQPGTSSQRRVNHTLMEHIMTRFPCVQVTHRLLEQVFPGSQASSSSSAEQPQQTGPSLGVHLEQSGRTVRERWTQS